MTNSFDVLGIPFNWDVIVRMSKTFVLFFTIFPNLTGCWFFFFVVTG